MVSEPAHALWSHRGGPVSTSQPISQSTELPQPSCPGRVQSVSIVPSRSRDVPAVVASINLQGPVALVHFGIASPEVALPTLHRHLRCPSLVALSPCIHSLPSLLLLQSLASPVVFICWTNSYSCLPCPPVLGARVVCSMAVNVSILGDVIQHTGVATCVTTWSPLCMKSRPSPTISKVRPSITSFILPCYSRRCSLLRRSLAHADVLLHLVQMAVEVPSQTGHPPTAHHFDQCPRIPPSPTSRYILQVPHRLLPPVGRWSRRDSDPSPPLRCAPMCPGRRQPFGSSEGIARYE